MTFEEAVPIIDEVLSLYRSRWTLIYYDYADLSQDIRAHAFKKWHLYDQTRPLKQWIATIIQNQIKNELRNRYYRYQAPCLKCPLHLGESQCKLYGAVSKRCGLYKKFITQKEHAANVNFPVSFEHANFDVKHNFSCAPKELVNSIYENISGVHKEIFILHYESGFCTTKIARNIEVSGMNFKERFNFISVSLNNTKQVAREIIEDKKISMGLEY